jgi:hypothetical protein
MAVVQPDPIRWRSFFGYSCLEAFSGTLGLLLRECTKILRVKPKAELLWVSPREILNICLVGEISCHFITCTNDMISKLNLVDGDVVEYSREEVQIIHCDAAASVSQSSRPRWPLDGGGPLRKGYSASCLR